MKFLMFRSRPKRKNRQQNNSFRQFFFNIQNKNAFEIVIIVFIVLNTVVMMIKWYGQSRESRQVIEILNIVFAVIFTLEAAIKIIGLGKLYFKDSWNVFDFIIVIGTFLGLLINYSTSVNIGNQTTILRAFRIFRVLRLVKRAKSLKMIFNTFIVTLPALANVGGLLSLLLYMFSIQAIYLFAKVKIAPPIHENANFSNFGNAIMTLLRISTGEMWHEVMYAVVRENSLTFQCIDEPSYE